MGYQTNYKKCKKCGGITITTYVIYLGLNKKAIISSNCKCAKK